MSNADDLLLGPDEPIAWPTTTLRKRDPEGRAGTSRSRQVMTPRGKPEEDRAPAVGVPQDVTLAEMLAEPSGLGYTTEFCIDADGRLCCRVCGVCAEPRTVEVEWIRRLEGASDPGDMAAVLAVRCRACGGRGLVVVRYGPETGAGEATFLSGLGRTGDGG